MSTKRKPKTPGKKRAKRKSEPKPRLRVTTPGTVARKSTTMRFPVDLLDLIAVAARAAGCSRTEYFHLICRQHFGLDAALAEVKKPEGE